MEVYLNFKQGELEKLPDNRSWLRRKWDNVITAYNSSSWANSAPADVIAAYGYSATGDEDSARLAVLPGAVGTTVKAAEEGVNLIYKHYGNDLSKYFHGGS